MHEFFSIFPCPVYKGKEYVIGKNEEEEFKKIVEQSGMHKNIGNHTSDNSNILDSKKLKNLKQYCKAQVDIYAKEVISPKEELDFYITQSWLNVTQPGGFHHEHWHQNSLISGVFYVNVQEGDDIMFNDPNVMIKTAIKIPPKEHNLWNSPQWFFPVENNQLVLFPSWLHHGVGVNEKATADRISFSFNTFVRGTLGDEEQMLNQLILK